eukprot:Partr_v1_DN25071_c0_g1_i1_m50912 putative carrier protein
MISMSPTVANLVGGTLGGLAGVAAGHPFDTVKVRLQSQNASAPIYRGAVHCVSTIVKKESVRGLFKGMTSPMVGVALVNSLLFGVYGAVLTQQTGDLPPGTHPALMQIFIAGSVSGMVNTFISTPVELVKIQLQNQGADFKGTGKKLPKSILISNVTSGLARTAYHTTATRLRDPPRTIDRSAFKGNLDFFKRVYASHGFRGFFRGFPVTFLRETPSYGAYFVSYEVFCRMLKPEGQDTLSGWRLMLAGGLGGVVGWGSTYPFDVVKTVIQSDTNIVMPKNRPMSTWECLRMMYREQGIRSLFRGFGATIVRAFPTNVAILTTWQMCMTAFEEAGWIRHTNP